MARKGRHSLEGMVGQMGRGSERDYSEFLSEKGRRAGDALITDPTASAKYISFMYGFPDSESLPAGSVTEVTHRVLTENPEWSLQYGQVTGPVEIRQALLEKLKRDQGISASIDQIMTTAGSSQAIQLLVQLLVDPGDTIIAESPTFLGFFDDIRNCGADICGVPVDEDGIRVDLLEERLRALREDGVRPRFMYLLPNYQNPTGVRLSLERRKRVVELAEEFDTLVIEDDAYFDLRYEGEVIPPIFALDPHGRTIYLGTLSKTLAAGFRIGWIVAPSASLILRVAALKTDGGSSIFGSFIAASWLPVHFEQHVAELREIYCRRRDLALAALEKYMPDGVTWSVPTGGFFIWVSLPDGLHTGRMLPQAREMGIEYLPGPACFFDHSGESQLRLSFSFAKDDVIEEGIRRLSDLVRAEIKEAVAV
jgi:2-aminoadipate transaminase